MTDTYTHVYRAYVQARIGFYPRPLDWTCVAGGPDPKTAREKAMDWVREVNRHQDNPTLYWVTVTRYDESVANRSFNRD